MVQAQLCRGLAAGRTTSGAIRALGATAVAAVVGATALTACGPPADTVQRLSAAAASFSTAVGDQDGSAVCALLTEDAARSVEQGSTGCAAAVGQLGLPDPGAVTSTQIWGRDALVTYAGSGADAFWTEVDGVWRVTAAGCTQKPDAPADCDLEAG
jgi:hypothetical protein